MGWTGYVMSIPAGMVFKKMYCGSCSCRLKLKKVTKLSTIGDEDFSAKFMFRGIAIGMEYLKRVTFVYKCPNCGLETTYNEQNDLRKRQIKFKKMMKKKNKTK